MVPPEEESTDNSELWSLAETVCNGTIGAEQYARLNALLLADENAARRYAMYVRMHGLLLWRWQDAEVTSSVPALPVILDASSFPAAHAPLFTGMFSPGGYLFSYSLAAFLVGIGLLIGWAYQVSIPPADQRQVVDAGPRPMPTGSLAESNMVFVGRVTDMVDCRWADPKTGTNNGAHIALGRKYALASGLMEITYDTGARAILQGPCLYEVESKSGGFLSLGRLTAKVQKRGEGRGEREGNAAGQQSIIGNRISPSPHSPLPSPLFFVRTPTAKVTDLGTEFGVEVDKSGVSKAYVYKGKVELRAVGAGGESGVAVRLGENESARVEIGNMRVATVVREAGQSTPFVRQMPKRVQIKLFNTGVNLKADQPDPHWQLAARTDDPKFKPRPAVVWAPPHAMWLPNQPDRSQWISAVGGDAILPDNVTYTFRTRFDLTETRPSTAVLHGRFVADNRVRAIRLNGHELPMPLQGHNEFGFYHAFSSYRGFIDGVNVLEIEVENVDPQNRVPSSQMGLRVELEGSVMTAWPEPSANVLKSP